MLVSCFLLFSMQCRQSDNSPCFCISESSIAPDFVNCLVIQVIDRDYVPKEERKSGNVWVNYT
jgi:hypothetical protein